MIGVVESQVVVTKAGVVLMVTYNIGRHDPNAELCYPKTPEGAADKIGTGPGKGFNVNIPFCGPEVS